MPRIAQLQLKMAEAERSTPATTRLAKKQLQAVDNRRMAAWAILFGAAAAASNQGGTTAQGSHGSGGGLRGDTNEERLQRMEDSLGRTNAEKGE